MEKISLKANKVKTHNLRKILPLYAKQKTWLTLMIIFLVLSGAVSIVMPIFSANALAMLAESRFDEAIKYAVLMCATGILKIIFNALDETFYIKVNLRIQYELTNMVVSSIHQVKMKKLDGTGLGIISERLSYDVSTITNVYLNMIDLFFSILTNVVFLFYIAYLNLYIFLVLLGYVAVLYVICTIKSRLWIRGRKLTKKEEEKARSAYIEQIAGIRDVKLLNIRNNVNDYSKKLYANALRFGNNARMKRNIVRRVQSAVSIIFELVFLVVGIAFVNKEILLLSGLLVIYMYYGRVEGLVGHLSSIKEVSADGEISATRIFEIIEDYEKEEFGSEELENFSGLIEFKNVNFAYNENEPVLMGLNIKFEPGQMTAIVGKSGSGKTTILSLMSKLYDIDSGEILLDGKEIKTLTEKSIRSNIGEISQAPYIFNTSIKQNLLFVKPDATDDEVIKVLKEAQIYNDIKKFEKGIDTEIGENGIKLSGGQKQRVAIARLLLMGSKVIVFDEATSSLDNESQKKIVDMLEKYKKDKTIVIVAHRLSTIVGADKIYMLENGKVVASGTHKELMQSCESYHELYELEEESATDFSEV